MNDKIVYFQEQNKICFVCLHFSLILISFSFELFWIGIIIFTGFKIQKVQKVYSVIFLPTLYSALQFLY